MLTLLTANANVTVLSENTIKQKCQTIKFYEIFLLRSNKSLNFAIYIIR